MRNFRKIIFILVAMVLILLVFMLQKGEKKEAPEALPLVALSTFSLYDIAKNVSQNTLELFMILPAGVDAHSFELTPKLMAAISRSDAVFYSGAGLEPWTSGLDFKSKAIDMSQHVTLRTLDAEEHHHEEEEHHHHTAVDPHYWLDLDNMVKATDIITAEFIKIAPQNKEFYTQNSEKYIAMLRALESDYKQALQNCAKDTIIVNHNAFSYIADKYGFHVEALSGFSPEAEPSPKNMARLIEHVKEHNVSVVFFESFVSDKAINSIANEANISAQVLHTLENITADEHKQNLDYENRMRANLVQLTKALECP